MWRSGRICGLFELALTLRLLIGPRQDLVNALQQGLRARDGFLALPDLFEQQNAVAPDGGELLVLGTYWMVGHGTPGLYSKQLSLSFVPANATGGTRTSESVRIFEELSF
jgi:hypothetical protein